MTGSAIDLRSDTVTRPDEEMRRAMATAEVGDDVYGEDPTVRQLEELAAERLGHEAALFVPSGTMGNQIALHLHAARGDDVLCEAGSHIVHYEMGAMAVISGLLPRTQEGARGRLDPAAVEAAISPGGDYLPRTGVIAVENTHNMAGGVPYEPERLTALIGVARRHGLPIHLDGARIFNAAEATGKTVAELAAGFDSVMFCLSKGLGAPVGSMLCGGREWIAEARRVRKMLGGGMRQAGVLAAAGLVALEKGPHHLAHDHRRARRLAEGLADLALLEVDPATVVTNIVIAGARAAADEVMAAGRRAGVLFGSAPGGQLRFVTHRDVADREIAQAVERLARVSVS